MNNKERNEVIMQLTCELMEKMGFEIDKAFVEDMVVEEGAASIGGSGEPREEKQVLVSLTVSNPAGLIGFRGRNLAALQLILGLMVKNKLNEWLRILLDINNYRAEQKERLMSMATSLAEKVKQTGVSVSMANMSAYERRICHMAIAGMEGVGSESEGEGEERHVVIKLTG